MILALGCLVSTLLGGALWTYLYDEHSSLAVRLTEGAFIGWSLFGLIGFVIASVNGSLTLPVVALAVYCVVFPPLLFVLFRQKKLFLTDVLILFVTSKKIVRRLYAHIFPLFMYILAIVGIWLSMSGAAYMKDGMIYTRYIDNYADFTLHAGIITGFVYGENFPPEHPDYAGSRLTYPFLSDFIAAMMVVAGLPLLDAMFWQSFIAMVFFVFLIHIWVRHFTKSGLAVAMVVALILLNGGLGWVVFFTEFLTSGMSIQEYLLLLPHDYTSHQETIRWVNSVVFWFVTMRSMFLGIPLFLIVTNIIWRSLHYSPLKRKLRWKDFFVKPERSAVRLIIGAGVIAALLPLVHTHSLLTLLFVTAIVFVLFRSVILGSIFLFVTLIVSFPQLVWLATDSAVVSREFFGFIWGWNQEEKNILWFWLVNTGVFIPLLLIALWKRNVIQQKLLLFYLPFLFCFIIPNFVKLAPWEWDNMKVIAYWYIFSTVPVALLLDFLWRKGFVYKLLTIVLFISMTLAGTLDNWRAWTTAGEVVIYDRQTLTMAEYIKKNLPPRSRIITALIHNNAVLMSGRQSYFGYPGRVWTHGMPWIPRQEEVKLVYTGGNGARELLERRNIEYVFVGPAERDWTEAQGGVLNEAFFSQYRLIAEVENTKIYRVAEGFSAH